MEVVMKKLYLVSVLVLVLTNIALAAGWTGGEILVITGGTYNLKDNNDWLSLKADAVYFGKPSADANIFFFYAGPGFKVAEWFYVSPRIGMNYNRPTPEKDYLLLSLWLDIIPMDNEYGNLWLFLEGDAYIHPEGQIFYGYYSFTYTPPGKASFIEFGVHAEQVDDLIFPGGIVEFKLKLDPLTMKIGAHYYGGFQKGAEGHTVRGVLKLFFSN